MNIQLNNSKISGSTAIAIEEQGVSVSFWTVIRR